MKTKELERAISKQIDIKLQLEEFYPDMIGEGKLTLERFERLLNRFEKVSIQIGIEQAKLKPW